MKLFNEQRACSACVAVLTLMSVSQQLTSAAQKTEIEPKVEVFIRERKTNINAHELSQQRSFVLKLPAIDDVPKPASNGGVHRSKPQPQPQPQHLQARNSTRRLLNGASADAASQSTSLLPAIRVAKICERQSRNSLATKQSRKLQQLCADYKHYLSFVLDAIRLAREECEWQFRFERWNCSLPSLASLQAPPSPPPATVGNGNGNGNSAPLVSSRAQNSIWSLQAARDEATTTTGGDAEIDNRLMSSAMLAAHPVQLAQVREAAFVNALTSAAIVHSIARACAAGTLAECTCSEQLKAAKRARNSRSSSSSSSSSRQSRNGKSNGKQQLTNSEQQLLSNALFDAASNAGKPFDELLTALHSAKSLQFSDCGDNVDFAYKFAQKLADDSAKAFLDANSTSARATATQQDGGERQQRARRALFATVDGGTTSSADARSADQALLEASKRRLMVSQNHLVGRREVARQAKLACQCVDVDADKQHQQAVVNKGIGDANNNSTGARRNCTQITCWRKLVPFRQIGANLKAKYSKAAHVKLDKLDAVAADDLPAAAALRSDNDAYSSKAAANKRNKRQNSNQNAQLLSDDTSLVYFEQTPDFCKLKQANKSEFKKVAQKFAFAGTSGRPCIADRASLLLKSKLPAKLRDAAKASGVESSLSCSKLCCSGQYKIVEAETKEFKCWCKTGLPVIETENKNGTADVSANAVSDNCIRVCKRKSTVSVCV